MLETKSIRKNIDLYSNRLLKRGLSDSKEKLNKIIHHDDNRKLYKAQLDNILTEYNQVSKQIGEKIQSGKKEEAEIMKKKSQKLKILKKKTSEKLKNEEAIIYEILTNLPNVPDEIVPSGNNEEDNDIIFESKRNINANKKLYPHWDLVKSFNLINFEKGNKITGAGFPVYIDKGAKLQRAIINFCIDQAIEKGYQEIQPPILVNDTSAFGTGQLPDKEGQMYKIENENLYMIPTAEVPITNLHSNEILNNSLLPIKNVAYTPCFRKEAGSWGSHVRGLNRLHQFDKVEILRVEHPEKSHHALEEMVEHVKSIIDKLGLPYRVLKLCGSDLGFASAFTYDFEVYSAAQKKWLEVSSVSNCESYQSNRLKLRYRNSDGNIELAHTLNGSALALPRIFATIIENYQTEKGIVIPEILVPYTGFSIIN